jgi:ubiquinone/menaquinone biosynthesis C-methylase UbiE
MTQKTTNAFHSREDIQLFYNNLSLHFDKTSSDITIRNRGLDVLDVQPGGKYLEIGSGQGDALIRLAKAVGKDGHVIGIDLSLGMNDLARKRLDEMGVSTRVELLTGDAIDLLSNQQEKSFDGVFMSFTLELLDHSEMLLLLKEIHRILKSNGRLVIVAMSKREADSPAWASTVYEWLSKRFPPQLEAKPIWLWRLAEDTEFTVKKLVLESFYDLPVDILLAAPQ